MSAAFQLMVGWFGVGQPILGAAEDLCKSYQVVHLDKS